MPSSAPTTWTRSTSATWTRRASSCRSGSSRMSPAAAIPPPTTIRSTPTRTTTLLAPIPRYRPTSIRPCCARGSPARAAATDSSAPGWPQAAAIASARASDSRQPLLPQLHRGPSGRIVWCPNSPPPPVSVATRPVWRRRGWVSRSTTAHFKFVPPRSRPRCRDMALIVPLVNGSRVGEIVTVLGPIRPDELGITDAHDHLFLRSPALPGQDFDDIDRAVEEVTHAASGGLRAIVEVTPIGLGRNPAGLRAVAQATGVHIIAATGYHRDAHYPADHWVRGSTVEQLAERILIDLRQGMHPADWMVEAPLDAALAGLIKAGASYQHISRLEERRLVAAAAGSQETGAPILVHTEIGTCGHEIVDLLMREGVRANRIILAHLDRNPDVELHRELADRGVWLEYDTPGRIKYRPDSQLLRSEDHTSELHHQI